MKNIVLLFFFCIYSCQTNNIIVSSKPVNITRKIISFKENKEVYLLMANNNDIIEAFKENNSNSCKKIKLGKSSSLKIIPVSDLIQHGVESPNEYILNDSTIIKYNHYYTLEKSQNICIIK
ncbi:hypothetical protein SD427_14525 [Chryseobacterium sp. JJR-5R]|uniref:hypothetical protein n=1 Tax=Chryseobacterium sp. JJR-5R TaxID=3093923 RepID=UPI002A762E93|nr:hypothetical protein [Chryseobacterium sp. JJR-5R]WPO81973.1 hypothetical protein SD427_14525 [Chryseobacterium sp. JJR-5R]